MILDLHNNNNKNNIQIIENLLHLLYLDLYLKVESKKFLCHYVVVQEIVQHHDDLFQ